MLRLMGVSAPSLHRECTNSTSDLPNVFQSRTWIQMHGATVREGINTDGERDSSQHSGQQLAAGVHVTAV